MKKLILAAAALTVAVLGFGGLKASTTYANPSNVWVINNNVATVLKGGAITWTAGGLTSADIASFGAWQTASAGQISSDPTHAGTVYIVVQTDGSTSPVSLTGRGLTCATVVGSAAICDGAAASTPAPVPTATPVGQFVIWQVTNVSSFAGGVTVTAMQNNVTLDSKTLTLVGAANNVALTATKTTVQEGATTCPLAATQTAPANGLGVLQYTDINGNSLVGYMPTFNSSAPSTLSVGNTATTSVPSPPAGQESISMLLADGKTIGAADSYCGVAAGTATLSAATIAGEVTGTSAPVTRTATITVGGVPASIALTASPATIACDGTQTSSVTAKVTDSAGNNVVDGTNVNFSVVALGTANPINVASKGGTASSTITPLSGSTAGVTVIVTSGSAQASIRVDCSLPVATPTSAAPAASPTSTTGITGPSTGTGGYLGQDGSAGFPMWTLVALVLGSLVLVGGGIVTRRAGK